MRRRVISVSRAATLGASVLVIGLVAGPALANTGSTGGLTCGPDQTVWVGWTVSTPSAVSVLDQYDDANGKLTTDTWNMASGTTNANTNRRSILGATVSSSTSTVSSVGTSCR